MVSPPFWRKLLGLGFGILSVGLAGAVPQDPVHWAIPGFQTTTSRDGLPQNSIMALTLDTKGRLWTATQDGAAVFDGHAWKTESMPERSTSNFIRYIILDQDDSLWFGRQDGGVARVK